MKEAGFKRKANWFSKEGEQYTNFVNILSSRYNTKDDLNFTLEMYVMPKGKKPLEARGTDFGKVGQLKTGKDKWYNLSKDIDSEKLGQEIGQDIANYILPFFDKYS